VTANIIIHPEGHVSTKQTTEANKAHTNERDPLLRDQMYKKKCTKKMLKLFSFNKEIWPFPPGVYSILYRYI